MRFPHAGNDAVRMKLIITTKLTAEETSEFKLRTASPSRQRTTKEERTTKLELPALSEPVHSHSEGCNSPNSKSVYKKHVLLV